MDMIGHSASHVTRSCCLKQKYIAERKETSMFDYFEKNHSQQFTFYRIPKMFFTDEILRELSTEAKVLYGLLLDRVSLSEKNGWYDKDSKVYVIFTLAAIQTAMGCAEKSAVKYLKELEKIGLVEKVRQGQGKPDLIYVKNFVHQENLQIKTSKTYRSSSVKNPGPDQYNFPTSYTEENDTDRSDTDHILSDDEERMRYEEYLAEHLDIFSLKSDYPYDTKLIDDFVEIILDVLTSKSKMIWISKEEKPLSVVKNRFMKLTSEHIRYIMECMNESSEKIRSPKQYLLAALYEAPVTMESYYRAAVRHDMASGKV